MSFVDVLYISRYRYFGLWLETESIIMPIAYRCKCRNIDELWRSPPTFRKQVVAPLLVAQVLLHLPTKSTSLFTILTYLQVVHCTYNMVVCKNRKKLHLRHWIGPLRLVDEWLIDFGYLPTFRRPNSSSLSVKCVIKKLF